MGHPQARDGSDQPERRENAARSPVPPAVPATEAWRKLERADDAVRNDDEMCATTGSGAAWKRAFCGVIAAPPASSVRRSVPTMLGTRLNVISAAGINQFNRAARVMIGLRWSRVGLLGAPQRCSATPK
jgi:hypothetical protein